MGISGAIAAAGLPSTACAPSAPPLVGPADPLDVLFPPDARRRIVTVRPRNPSAPAVLDVRGARRALVVGGGVAGLSAALELAERGYAVQVREGSTVFGGRLATHDLDPGVGRNFRVEHGLHMWFDNYRTFADIRHRLGVNDRFRPYREVDFVFRNHRPERLESTPKIFPFNLAGIVDRSPNLEWSDVFGSLGIFGDLLAFTTKRLYERLDDTTFLQWIERSGVSPTFRDVVFLPAAHVTLNRVQDLSAAEMLLFQHLYFTSQPYAFDRSVSTVDHATAVIDPWVARLRELGVQLRASAPVPGLRFESGRAVGVVGEAESFDWVVLATDVRATQSVLAGSQTDAASAAAVAQIRSGLSALRIAPPYRILRVWLDRPLAPGRPDVIETPQHDPIALIAQFHQLEDESRSWAAETGGAVLEFHLYALEDDLATIDDDAVWFRIRPTAIEVLPELADARLLGSTVGTFENFTSFGVGQGRVRPDHIAPRDRGLANLFLAGDWVACVAPSALMERAALTGRLAANECLVADGVREAGYSHVSPFGPTR